MVYVRLVYVLALCAACFGHSAFASAWPRAKGQTFFAASSSLAFTFEDGERLDVAIEPSVYLEYGWSESVTVGFDASRDSLTRRTTAFAFLRRPLGDTERRDRFAWSIGLGGETDPDLPSDVLSRAGLHWARGFETGWLSADASAAFAHGRRDVTYKIDTTWGLRPHDRWMVVLQAQGYMRGDQRMVKIAPSAVWSASNRIKVEIGAVKEVSGGDKIKLRLGTWLEF